MGEWSHGEKRTSIGVRRFDGERAPCRNEAMHAMQWVRSSTATIATSELQTVYWGCVNRVDVLMLSNIDTRSEKGDGGRISSSPFCVYP
ncbi:hypothetical protein GGGNBK_21205 [Sporosarcina sp. ANT_H38]